MPSRRSAPSAKPVPEGGSKEKVELQGPAPNPAEALRLSGEALEIFNEDWKDLNLHGKIARISGHLGRIPKNGYNKFNGYWYVLESDLVEHIRWYLAAAAILIYPDTIREHTVHTFEGQTTGQQSRQRDILTDNIVVYRVVDGKDGTTFTFEVNGQGSDPRDKGSNKASTSAMKFAYLRLFNIASGEESEGDTVGDQAAATGGSQPNVEVKASSVEGAQRGGKQEKASGTQIKMVSNLSNQLDLGATGLVDVIERILGIKLELPEDPAKHSGVLGKFLTEQKGEDVGKVIYALQQSVEAAKDVDEGSGY